MVYLSVWFCLSGELDSMGISCKIHILTFFLSNIVFKMIKCIKCYINKLFYLYRNALTC